MPTRQDLDPSPALGIVEKGPHRFEGRKLGIMVTDRNGCKSAGRALKGGTLEKAGGDL